MKRVKRLGFILLAGIVLGLGACKKKEDTSSNPSGGGSPTESWVDIGHEHDAHDRYHVYLYGALPAGQTAFTEGYNRFRVRITQANGAAYTGRDVRFLPMMYMRNMAHSCPVEQPTGVSQDGYYYGAAFFMMPSDTDEPWKLHVAMGSDTVTFSLQVNPHPRGWVRRGRQFGNPNNPPYLYELRLANAAVGSQDVMLYVYKRDVAQPATQPEGYPAATEFSKIAIQTWMPSMGHGAQGSQDAMPVSGKPGHYAGKAGFSMTGDWHIYTTFIGVNGDTIGRDTFALEF
ncbi:MAG: FixH family protein [Bacteroidia bacterium]|jgi:hypothetical protein|nr:FixH family protein [Bacteroidia bacterium]GIV23396.1 MAG: hypothetical protein KatS3mg025_1055 [Bacteroidia bacterium]